ncbi:MAG: hypothetical protein HZB14_06575 [Actinobacteria bacterium]|nr:hypothetical protein [Actinomycetota bacterium]
MFEDINARPNGVIIVGWNSNRWTPLEQPAQAPLGVARKASDEFARLASHAVQSSEPRRLDQLEKALIPLRRVLEQDNGSRGAPGASVESIKESVENAVAQVVTIVENLPTANYHGGRFIVPDTNAFLWQPDVSLWDTGGPVTLVIVPQVIQELDRLKTRDGSVGPKATKIINQLNEFDRRGNTLEGVKVAGDLWLREIAIQPSFESVPPWLDSSSADDQIIASALELGFADLTAQVAVVTRDRNMKNRCRMAQLEVVPIDELVSAKTSHDPAP